MARRRRRQQFGRRRRSRGAGPWLSVMVLALLGLGAIGFLEWQPNSTTALPETHDCRIAYVVDGDTLQVRCPERGVFRARLVGYDAPEVFSPECDEERRKGREATRALRAMLEEAEDLVFAFGDTDEYGRALLTLSVDGRNVARRMIEAGYGQRYAGGRQEGWCE